MRLSCCASSLPPVEAFVERVYSSGLPKPFYLPFVHPDIRVVDKSLTQQVGMHHSRVLISEHESILPVALCQGRGDGYVTADDQSLRRGCCARHSREAHSSATRL